MGFPSESLSTNVSEKMIALAARRARLKWEMGEKLRLQIAKDGIDSRPSKILMDSLAEAIRGEGVK